MPALPAPSVFIDALTKLGGSTGNQKLQGTLGWPADCYDALKERLLQEGKIESGHGRGGSVKLVNTAPDLFSLAATPVPAESAKLEAAIKANLKGLVYGA